MIVTAAAARYVRFAPFRSAAVSACVCTRHERAGSSRPNVECPLRWGSDRIWPAVPHAPPLTERSQDGSAPAWHDRRRGVATPCHAASTRASAATGALSAPADTSSNPRAPLPSRAGRRSPPDPAESCIAGGSVGGTTQHLGTHPYKRKRRLHCVAQWGLTAARIPPIQELLGVQRSVARGPACDIGLQT